MSRDETWGDIPLAMLISIRLSMYMTILRVENNTVSELRINNHEIPLEDVDLVLIHNGRDHFSGACKKKNFCECKCFLKVQHIYFMKYISVSETFIQPIVRPVGRHAQNKPTTETEKHLRDVLLVQVQEGIS